MKFMTILGWIVILLLCSIPIFLWLVLGPGFADLTNYANITHSIGELAGLVGVTMFALTFVLSTRISFIEDIFGGLDKVYLTHGVLGGTALILILAHPIFLVLKFIPANIPLASTYLSPSSYWQVNFGIIAIAGLILLIMMTLFIKIKYNTWKFSHEFLGLVFIIAVLHIFLVRGTVSSDNIFYGYYWFASIVSFTGISAYAYSLFIKGRLMKNAVYTISEISHKNDFFEISMVPDLKPIPYRSGQFVFVRFYNRKLSEESHPFSIASKSNSDAIKIVVKKLGDYTDKMQSLKVGDKVSVEGAYGRFNYKNYGRDQVWIAGGIGITPFLGMVQDFYEDKKISNQIYLYYSVKDDSEFIGYDLLKDIAANNSRFKFMPWNTSKQGYITSKTLHDLTGDYKDKEFFLCGPPRFKSTIIDDLMRSGVPDQRIHEEAFDFI